MSAAACPEDLLEKITKLCASAPDQGLEEIESLVARYGGDPRLHFLQGSIEASLGRYDDARKAMQRALNLSPEFHLARFQLGFLELTSGRQLEATTVWAPLGGLSSDHPLRLFSEGLEHLIKDEFNDCVRLLKAGIGRNQEVEPLNRDMQLIIDGLAAMPTTPAAIDEPTSSAQMLLNQFGRKPTQH